MAVVYVIVDGADGVLWGVGDAGGEEGATGLGVADVVEADGPFEGGCAGGVLRGGGAGAFCDYVEALEGFRTRVSDGVVFWRSLRARIVQLNSTSRLS